ncbi:cellulose synthase complex periplasmic endoglucanase BcsZ [Lonsdalea quercina]|uniref:cellulose synthase complex periplasmic endoglucanase BcsZ n=1 Tax=Lonsdalea quercina TaxID=71657 RepID=UPI0039764202
MKRLTVYCCGLLALWFSSVTTAECRWPQWEQFRQAYISADGQVIDPNEGDPITTSEGQSYALFFALAANDRDSFDRILTWTETHLAKGDLTLRLPGWLWGRDAATGRETLLDDNSAADADLWIAYSLLQAGKLWQSRTYQVMGTLLLQRIAREETAEIPDLGPVLLPGKHGFASQTSWTVNPSYLPPPLLASFAEQSRLWSRLHRTTIKLLIDTAPRGFSPDWIVWTSGAGWHFDETKGPIGSYNAIRVYLWAGMLEDGDPDKTPLLQAFMPMVRYVEAHGAPPERVNVSYAAGDPLGNVGFSAALMPLLQHSPALSDQRQRAWNSPFSEKAYYRTVLTLFGTGWDSHFFRFSPHGDVIPAWKETCVTSR